MDGAHAGAAAEMGDDHPRIAQLRRDFRQAAGDVLVGQAVEAITAHALLRQLPRDGEGLCLPGLVAVEGGVEAGDLRQLRMRLRQRADGGEVVRLVQRGERDQTVQLIQHGGGQQHRGGVADAAMNHPVTGGDQRRPL